MSVGVQKVGGLELGVIGHIKDPRSYKQAFHCQDL